MLIIDSLKAMQEKADRDRDEGNRVGFVPTMGCLHEGHLSLMRTARKENHVVTASIFVNPSQFAPHEDFAAYPRDLPRDSALCREAGVDVLFTPRAEEMYPAGFATTIHVAGLTEGLCGRSRPIHFDGVATVVTKLFSIVRPHRAYFGLKDYQQFRVIERMASDLNLPVEVIGLPTVRASDGLAMSSRNAYLSPEERKSALSLSRALAEAEMMVREGRRGREILLSRVRQIIEAEAGTRIDYAELAHPMTLRPLDEVGPEGSLLALAVYVGKTRLIDNLILK